VHVLVISVFVLLSVTSLLVIMYDLSELLAAW
jgi:hypothetical protein